MPANHRPIGARLKGQLQIAARAAAQFLAAHQRLEVATAVRDAKDKHVTVCDGVDDDMAFNRKTSSAGA
jgi:hypothetical protein